MTLVIIANIRKPGNLQRQVSLNKPPTTCLSALTFMDVVCTSGWGTSRPASGGACTASKVLSETAKRGEKITQLAWLQ